MRQRHRGSVHEFLNFSLISGPFAFGQGRGERHDHRFDLVQGAWHCITCWACAVVGNDLTLRVSVTIDCVQPIAGQSCAVVSSGLAAGKPALVSS